MNTSIFAERIQSPAIFINPFFTNLGDDIYINISSYGQEEVGELCRILKEGSAQQLMSYLTGVGDSEIGDHLIALLTVSQKGWDDVEDIYPSDADLEEEDEYAEETK